MTIATYGIHTEKPFRSITYPVTIKGAPIITTHIYILFLCELELVMKLLLIVATLLGLVLLTTAGGGRRRKCPFIDRPDNGYGRGSRRIGNSIRFSCKRGYWLQGPQSLTCLDVKGQPTWSSSVIPFCVLKSKLTISPYIVS